MAFVAQIRRLFDVQAARTLAIVAVVTLAGLWIAVAVLLAEERQKIEQGAFKDAANYARIVEEHTARTLQSADQLIRFVQRGAEAQQKAFDLNRFLGMNVSQGGLINLVSIVDEKGFVSQSTLPFTRIDLSDREHIKIHMTGYADNLFISKPVLGRVSHKWSIQLTRRINGPDGRFAGVVVLSIDPFYFTRLYGDIEIGDKGAIFVAADDGIIRARRSAGADTIGQDISDGIVFSATQKSQSGIVRTRSRLDQTERFYAFRHLEGYPLIAAVGLGVDDAMQPYYEYRNMLLLMALLMTVLTVVLKVILAMKLRQLESSRQRAVAANEAKSVFLANMSHELRTPLNGIIGYAELLEMDLAGTKQLEFAQAISHSGEHLLSLVNSLLDLAKVESGKLSLNLAPQDVSEILRHTIDGHLASAMKKHLDLKFDIDPGLPRRSLIDRMRFVQILNNLIHNAIKFTEKGAVKISAAARGANLEIEVADSGPGIDAAMHESVFQKFVQVDGSERRDHEGTGLGLALARELVELMEGRIWVESMPGQGARFKFTLPFRQPLYATAGGVK